MRVRALAFVFCTSAIVWACGSADGALFGDKNHQRDAGSGASSSPDAALDDTGGRSSGGRSAASGGNVSMPDASTRRTCKNSLDCVDAPDGRQVCDRAAGLCVECVARADCSGTTQCYDGHCRAACVSDKDCTSQGLLCDSAAGHCVECQVDGDCAGREVCVAGSCESSPPPGSGGAGSGGTGAGGRAETGGALASGGLPGTGGNPGAGGAGAGGAPQPTCADGKKNGAETDVDCGGATCPGCPIGARCTVNTDCMNSSCNAGMCGMAQATCTDKIKNGGETGVDCGQTCPPCDKGQPCLVGADCISKACSNGTCAEASCGDGIKNGMETSVDCGGGCPCRVGSNCVRPSDCASGNCVVSSSGTTGTCGPGATCTDGTRDGAETAPDCGGPACNRCAAGKSCEQPADCASAMCTSKVCGSCDPTKCPKTIPPYAPCCTAAGACGTGISTLCL